MDTEKQEDIEEEDYEQDLEEELEYDTEEEIDVLEQEPEPEQEDQDFDYDKEETKKERKVLASEILLSYCKIAQNEIDRARQGVHSAVDFAIIGRGITAEDIIEKLYDVAPKTDRSDKGTTENTIIVMVVGVLLSIIYIEYFVYGLIGTIIIAGSYYVLSMQPQMADDPPQCEEYIRLRSPTDLLEVMGDMAGVLSTILEDSTGKNPIVDEIDKIANKLTTLGGSLDIYTLDRIAYIVNKVEGIAYMLAHLEVTTEDMREAMTAPPTYQHPDEGMEAVVF